MNSLAIIMLFGPAGMTFAAQDSFRPSEAPVSRSLSVQTPNRAEYSAHEEGVRRRIADEEIALDSTTPDGTGAVHALGVHVAGTVFVAAENGLFRTSDDVDHLDPVEFYEGVPAGVPVGVVPRGETRVWVATRSEFGCIDSRQFFGRTFSEEDGVPAGPYLGLVDDQMGGLLLQTQHGTFRYEPARGDRPTVRVLSLNGREFIPEQRVDVDAAGSIQLELDGEALGGASYRYRSLHHHLWYPLDVADPKITGLEPGPHSILITAWDRNLRRSVPVQVDVDVAYPKVFDKRVLVPIAVSAGLLVLGAWVLLAVRSGGGTLRLYKAFVSAFVFCAVGLQILSGLVPHARSWPFVGFTMYTERYVENSVTYKQVLYGVERNGELHHVQPYNAGYGLLEFRRTLAPVIHGTRPERAGFLDSLNGRFPGRPFKGFLIVDERHRLTRRGPVPVAPTVLCTYPRKVLHD